MLVVLPDTNILLSTRLLDLLMRSHAAGLIQVVWCDELMDEYCDKLIDVRGRTASQADASIARFKAAAPDGRIHPDDYTDLVPLMTGRDPDDHVLSAAARGGRADVVVTENLSDFPDADLGDDCVALDAAHLFGRLAELYPGDLAVIVTRASANLSRPPLSPHDILDRLADIGLTDMADRVRPRL